MDTARDFTHRLQYLLGRERAALAEFLVVLADFDRQRPWLEAGHASLFDFLHRELGLSKASASFRKKATELVQRFPEIVELLRDGRLCLLWNDRSTTRNVRSFRPDQAALEMAQLDG